MSSIDDERKKFEAKLDQKVTLRCTHCGYECQEDDKACPACGTRRPGKVLDSPDTCQHSPVTALTRHCTNCGKKL